MIVLGIVLVICGLGFAWLAFMAAGMASRATTAWESIGIPSLGLAAAVIGVVLFFV